MFGINVDPSAVNLEAPHEVNRFLDEGAAQTGRNPSEVRRGYNLFGAVKLRAGESYRFNRPAWCWERLPSGSKPSSVIISNTGMTP